MRIAALVLLATLGAASARADVAVPVPASGKHGAGTFCEFSVFHAEDGQPMAGVRYRVTLPSGKVRRGRVPANGIVHIDVPRAGECSIDLDLPAGYRIADER